MQIAPDPTAADELVALFSKETDADIRRNILQALAAGKSPKAAPLAVEVLKNAKANAALVPDAVAVIQTTGAKDAGPALIAIADANTAPEVLEPAFQRSARSSRSPPSPRSRSTSATRSRPSTTRRSAPFGRSAGSPRPRP